MQGKHGSRKTLALDLVPKTFSPERVDQDPPYCTDLIWFVYFAMCPGSTEVLDPLHERLPDNKGVAITFRICMTIVRWWDEDLIGILLSWSLICGGPQANVVPKHGREDRWVEHRSCSGLCLQHVHELHVEPRMAERIEEISLEECKSKHLFLILQRCFLDASACGIGEPGPFPWRDVATVLERLCATFSGETEGTSQRPSFGDGWAQKIILHGGSIYVSCFIISSWSVKFGDDHGSWFLLRNYQPTVLNRMRWVYLSPEFAVLGHSLSPVR